MLVIIVSVKWLSPQGLSLQSPAAVQVAVTLVMTVPLLVRHCIFQPGWMSTRQVSQPSLITSLFTRYLRALQLGNVYIADYGNNRIHKVTMSTVTSSPRYLLLLIKLDYSLTHSLTHSSLFPFYSSIIPSVVPLTTSPSTPSPRYEWNPYSSSSLRTSFTHSIFIHIAWVLLWFHQLHLQPRPHPVVITQVWVRV